MDTKIHSVSDNTSFSGSVDLSKNAMKEALGYLVNSDVTSETAKEIRQFINTLRAIYKDKSANVLRLEHKSIKKSVDNNIPSGDYFVTTYGSDFKQIYRWSDDEHSAFWEIIKFGKKYFGENKLNEPIADFSELEHAKRNINAFNIQQNNFSILIRNIMSFLIK